MHKDDSQAILLIDDDPKNLQIAMKILKDYKVIFAQNGEKALELLEKNENFDLILLDVVMPIMDGYETCKKIKSNEKYKDIPVIFSTVKDEAKDIVKGFELGAVDYLVKPFYPEVLLKRVELHLNLSKSNKELKELNSSLNERVAKQIQEIRERDEKLAQQEKIRALNDIVGIISGELRNPISNMRIYLQSLEIMFESTSNKVMAESFNNVLDEVAHVEEGLEDFCNLLSTDKRVEYINFKVALDSVIFKYRSILTDKKIKFNFIGDNLISFDFVEDELKQILAKMILISLGSFSQSDVENREINLDIKQVDEKINIFYYDNSGFSKFKDLDYYFDNDYLIKSKKFDINMYILKLLVEKNGGKLELEKNQNDSILFIIEFAISS